MASLVSQPSTANIINQLEPVLIQYREQSERDRKLAPEVARAMIEAGVFQSLVPKAFGGMELDPLDALQLYEGIARIDGSAGWIAVNQSGLATLVALETKLIELHPHFDAILAGMSLSRKGDATLIF